MSEWKNTFGAIKPLLDLEGYLRLGYHGLQQQQQSSESCSFGEGWSQESRS